MNWTPKNLSLGYFIVDAGMPCAFASSRDISTMYI